jgi:hypothetical protein
VTFLTDIQLMACRRRNAELRENPWLSTFPIVPSRYKYI